LYSPGGSEDGSVSLSMAYDSLLRQLINHAHIRHTSWSANHSVPISDSHDDDFTIIYAGSNDTMLDSVHRAMMNGFTGFQVMWFLH